MDRVANPAMIDLFKEDNSKKLNENERATFHKFVVTGLYLSKRARLDIQPVILVLCTRVKSPGRNNWNKLVRMMKFLKVTREDKLTINTEKGINEIEWYVDAAFAVHPDFKSHMGAVMVYKGGKGMIQGSSARNRKSIRIALRHWKWSEWTRFYL